MSDNDVIPGSGTMGNDRTCMPRTVCYSFACPESVIIRLRIEHVPIGESRAHFLSSGKRGSISCI